MCNLENMFCRGILREHCPNVTQVIAVHQIQKKKSNSRNKLLRRSVVVLLITTVVQIALNEQYKEGKNILVNFGVLKSPEDLNSGNSFGLFCHVEALASVEHSQLYR